jgi:hypothetical protein
MSNELTVKSEQHQIAHPSNQNGGIFENSANFEHAQRVANAFASSDLVPKQYQKNVANCLVAMEVARSVGASVMSVFQNLNIIHGKPSWSSTYIIAAINSCGKFAPLRFKVTGTGDDKTCIAWTMDKTGEVLESPPVSIRMAKAEGWFQKTGSKWQTMEDLMLRYRAAAFFGRLYAPEILMGMRSEDEARDVIEVTSEAAETAAVTTSLNEKIKAAKKPAKPKIEEPSSLEVSDPVEDYGAPEEYFANDMKTGGDDHF